MLWCLSETCYVLDKMKHIFFSIKQANIIHFQSSNMSSEKEIIVQMPIKLFLSFATAVDSEMSLRQSMLMFGGRKVTSNLMTKCN